MNAIGDQLYLLPIFQFTYTDNNCISLGLLNTTTPVGRWMLVGLTISIAVWFAVWIGKELNRLDQRALGMVRGGALGNILDRTLHCYVTDFMDLHFGEFRPFLIFFFSSRRRHTRWNCDWSSDVCSSD